MTLSIPRLGQRSSGVLLHVTSLPGASCCGDLGAGARTFVDFLYEAGQRWWQMLPLNPIDRYNSPYSSLSAFAGEPLMIDLQELVRDGLLDPEDHDFTPCGPVSHAAYQAARDYRMPRWQKAFTRFRRRYIDGATYGSAVGLDLEQFVDENRNWLDDHAMFCALTEKYGTNIWTDWPDAEIRDRQPNALDAARTELKDRIAFHIFLQYIFEQQWQKLRAYCHESGVGLIGDIPIYVSPGSVDVWANRENYILDDVGRPTYIAAVPGDDFNPEGQRWNAPLYRWDVMRDNKFDWWMQRLETTFRRFDAVRLDHFIGFYNYYQLPVDENSTVGAGWFPACGTELFNTIHENFPDAQLIAEDLGVMNQGVRDLRDNFGLPGLNVLQFAFCGSDEMTDEPENGNVAESNVTEAWPENSVVCTGTHDTDTALGWFRTDVLPNFRHANLASGNTDGNAVEVTGDSSGVIAPLDFDLVAKSIGLIEPSNELPGLDVAISGDNHLTPKTTVQTTPAAPAMPDIENVHWAMIRTVMQSRAHLAIFPMQDVLGLGSESRMNRPGIADGNWAWRLRDEQLTDELSAQLRQFTKQAGRINAE